MSLDSEVRAAIRSSFCSGMDTYDRVAGGAAKALGGNTLAGKAANAARAMFCDAPPFPVSDGQFTGGQCPTKYNISGRIPVFNDEGEALSDLTFSHGGSITNLMYGPVAGVFKRLDSGGKVVVYTSARDGAGNYKELTRTTNRPPDQVGEVYNIVVTRIDNQPDSCGDPEKVVPPHPPGGITSPITINNNTGILNIGEFNIDNGGGLRVPITVDLPDFPLIGELNLGKGEINIGFGGSGGDSPDNVLKPDDEPLNPDEPADEATAVSNIVGVLVVVSSLDSTNKATSIFQSGVPNIYAPRLGNVNFKYRTGSKITWSSDLRVKNFNNFIPNPSGYGAIDVVVNADEGVTYQAFAVRGVSPIDVVEV